jgi:hypothetical protein
MRRLQVWRGKETLLTVAARAMELAQILISLSSKI